MELVEKSKLFPLQVIQIIHCHHERYDGSGYPQKLSENDIPLLATIAGLVDCYQAGTSARPYRKAKTSFAMLMELYGERDRGFPGAVIEQFIQCIGIFPIGSFVQLNTREVGVVVQRNQIQQLKPRVMILISPKGKRIPKPETIDLSAQYLEEGQTPRGIVQVVDPAKYKLDPGEFFV